MIRFSFSTRGMEPPPPLSKLLDDVTSRLLWMLLESLSFLLCEECDFSSDDLCLGDDAFSFPLLPFLFGTVGGVLLIIGGASAIVGTAANASAT